MDIPEDFMLKDKAIQDCLFTTDKKKMNIAEIHHWLSTESYWAKDITYEKVKRAFDYSYCFGLIKDGHQIAYGRFITDYTNFAYLADVYVLEAYRNRGLAKQMLQIVLKAPWILQLRKILLATLDAHALYKGFGFDEIKLPMRLMEKAQN